MSKHAEEADDATIVVNDATVVVNDATIAVNAAAAAVHVQNDAEHSAKIAVSGPSGSEAMPVAEPEMKSGGLFSARAGAGLDPARPIAPAPGRLPWEALPEGERGVTQGLPVSYGARPQVETPLQTGIDEVQRQLGPAPQGYPVVVRAGRETLPSLRRRDRRRRAVTLALYCAVVVVCVLGIWWVASIAFG